MKKNVKLFTKRDVLQSMRTNVQLNMSQNVKMTTVMVDLEANLVMVVKKIVKQSQWKIVDKWQYPIVDRLLMNNADKHPKESVPMCQEKNVTKSPDITANK